MDDDAVMVASDSDEEANIDNDAVVVGASARVHPTDVGFTDFSDFGGFQDERVSAPDVTTSPHRVGSESPPSETGRRSFDSPVGSQEAERWNAFADPTDAGMTPHPLT